MKNVIVYRRIREPDDMTKLIDVNRKVIAEPGFGQNSNLTVKRVLKSTLDSQIMS